MNLLPRAISIWFFFFASCGEDRSSEYSEMNGSRTSFERSVEEIEQLRLESDQLVFFEEREAQRHETAFVRLWDNMRAGDPFAALAEFPFQDIAIPSPGAPETVSFSSYPIRQVVFSGAADLLAPAVARKALASAQSAGWRIIQSEWHHDMFHPAREGKPPQSLFSFEVHSEHTDSITRCILKGKLAVSWMVSNDPSDAPVPGRLVVQEMQSLQMQGPPPFRKMTVIDPFLLGKPPSRSPLLAQDLNGDGLSEIIVVGANLLFTNMGNGRFDKKDFLQVPSPRPSDAGVLADFTGDGHLDFVGASQSDLRLMIFEGDGNGQFAKQGRICFEEQLNHPQVLTTGDLDGDGDLDLFLGQYRAPYQDGSMPTPFHDANDGHPDFLLLNNGSGQFFDATSSSGLSHNRSRRTYAASFVDLDDDEDLDLVVTADFARMDLYQNDDAFIETSR